jgi:hypothetical protein
MGRISKSIIILTGPTEITGGEYGTQKVKESCAE